MFYRSIPSTIVATLLLATSLTAQTTNPATLTIAQSVLHAGGSASISYCNPALANQTIVIDVDNGMRRGTLTSVIELHLDASGFASTLWTVPSWLGANFNAPGVNEEHRVIL